MINSNWDVLKIELKSSYLLLWNPSDKLPRRFDHELKINLKQSTNFILFVAILPLSSSFLIITEKEIYFSVSSPEHSICPSNSSARFLISKW